MNIKTKHFRHTVVSTLMVTAAAACLPAFAQDKKDDPQMDIYRATATKVNDLIHTKLDVSFNYKKRHMYGKEWVTIKPHLYPTDSLRLDAQGMDIKNLSIVKNGKNVPLKY
ncbi:MAG: M1 family peptidase, partial [Pedobacter sp.]